MGSEFLTKWKKPLGQLMVKMFGKIQHKLGVERTGPEWFKGGVRSDGCKSLLGIVVRRIGHEGKNCKSLLGTVVRGI